MKIFGVLLQIAELFEGHFNWRGLAQLLLLVLMALIAVGFAVFVSYKAFQSKSKK
ncbi:MAG: hypothetical protein LH472_02450 [Pyrinomonadaceae bacterium]|nr:hypothetical protein [Pyrinomonadaceae bacterium]